MANIIVIEDDPRVEKQIKQYIGELDGGEENKVRYFNSQEAFEARYFNKAAQKEASPLLKIPVFKNWSSIHIDWLLERTLEASPAFPQESLNIVLDPSGLKISKIDPEIGDEDSLFGEVYGQLKETASPIKNLIGSPFRPVYQDLIQQAIDKKQQINEFTFPVAAGDTGRFWLISISIEQKEAELVLTVKNQTEEVRNSFEDEREKFKKEAGDEGVELDLLGSIDLILLKFTMIKNFRKGYISKTLKQIADYGYQPLNKKTKFLILKYEDDGTKKIDLLDPRINDLIYLPLDRALFLQKLDIVLAQPELIVPKFLFQQDVDMDISISKRTFIEDISDVGIGIRNPMALKPGLMGHFYFEFPGDEETIEIYGKVQRSTPHPEIEKQFIVYFTFVAISRDILTKVRRFLSQNPRYMNLKSEDKEEFKFNPDNVFNTEDQRRVKNIVVVNPDEKMIQQISSNINDNFDQVRVVGDTSYSNFLKKYFNDDTDNETPAESPIDLESTRPVSSEDLCGDSLIFYVHSSNHSILAPLPPSEYSELEVLGYPAYEMLSHTDKWLKMMFPLEDSRDEMKEALGAAWMGRTVSKTIILRNKNMDPKAALVKMEKRSEDESIKVTFEPASEQLVKEKILLEAPISTFDCIIIDSHYVPEDIDSWILGLSDYCKLKALLPEDKKLKIIVMGNEDSQLDPSLYSHTNIRGICQAPLDTRSFLLSVSAAINNNFSIYSFDNISWLDTRIPVQIAKPVKLLKISEFGGSINCPVPIAPGTFLFVRGNIFNQAPRGNLCIRFYGSEKTEDEDYPYTCHMLYYGINENFMKFARNWFRETYAASKQKQG